MSDAPEVIDVPSADHVTRTRTIDLDAARKARAEARARAAGEDEVKPPALRLEGEDHPMPHEMPLSCLTAFGEVMALRNAQEGDELDSSSFDKMTDAVRELIGPVAFGAVQPSLSIEDLMFLLTEAMELYGFALGESVASEPS